MPVYFFLAGQETSHTCTPRRDCDWISPTSPDVEFNLRGSVAQVHQLHRRDKDKGHVHDTNSTTLKPSAKEGSQGGSQIGARRYMVIVEAPSTDGGHAGP